MGSAYSYTGNLTQGEHSTFACYTGARLDAKSMQEVSVTVTVQEGEGLTLGIKSGLLRGGAALLPWAPTGLASSVWTTSVLRRWRQAAQGLPSLCHVRRRAGHTGIHDLM